MSEANQNYVRIPLTQGKFAIIDAEDLPEIGKYTWCYGSNKAIRSLSSKERNETGDKRISMHRQLMNAPKGFEIDHIDGNPLNNSRSNLRITDHTGNMRNKGVRRDCFSGKKGVTFDKRRNHYRASIRINNKAVHLGVFDTVEEAHEAYRKRAKEEHGEFFCVERNSTKDYSHVPIAPKVVRTNLTESGYLGVYKYRRKWKALYGKNGYLGLFNTPEEASAAVEAKRKELAT